MDRFDDLFSGSKSQKISNITIFTLFYVIVYSVVIFCTSLIDISRYMWTLVAYVTIGLILNYKNHSLHGYDMF
jgi:hypothetical protein